MPILLTRRSAVLGGAAVTLPWPVLAQNRELTVGLASTSFGTAGPRLAKELGLYARRGVDVRFIVMESANAATTALVSGSLKVALSGAGELIAAQARGQPVVAVVNTAGGLTGTVVLSRSVVERLGVAPAAPIQQRLKALDGVLIASTTATSAYTVSVRSAAKEAGADVRFTYMAQPAMTAALDAGAVQGSIAGAPFWASPVVKGTGVVWISGPKGELTGRFVPVSSGNIQVMREFA